MIWHSPCARASSKMMDHPRDYAKMKGVLEPRGWGCKWRENLINAYGMVSEIMRVCHETTMRWILVRGIFLDHITQDNHIDKHWIMIANLILKKKLQCGVGKSFKWYNLYLKINITCMFLGCYYRCGLKMKYNKR